jgi:tRNA threonylcarbamoyladenosine biosynthesis protein TsaE
MDFYRLDSVSVIDAQAMGLKEAFATGLNLIEWSDRLSPDMVPAERLEVHISYTARADERDIRLVSCGRMWDPIANWFASQANEKS